ncbi:MAG: DNA translocase FtsK 4TM domain-containing protein [Patescibacteria group bacterium]
MKKNFKKNKKSSFKEERDSKKEVGREPGFSLSPDTKREIASITLMVLGIVCFLSLFSLFGVVGGAIHDILRQGLGWGSYLFAFSLVGVGYALFFPDRFRLHPATYIGLTAVNVLVPMLIHVFVNTDMSLATAADGNAGGFVGHLLGTGLKQSVSLTGALIILLALIIVSVLVVFNTSLKRIQETLETEALEAETNATEQIGRLKINLPKINLKDLANAKNADSDDDEKPPVKEGISPFKKKEAATPKEGDKPEKTVQDQDWKYPATNILDSSKYTVESGNVKGNAEIISKTLSQFGIGVTMQDVNVGPTFTQYTLKPSEGMKLSKITNLQDDLALALATHPIRIEAPIPGKSLVGVEVPNKKVAQVRLRELLESGEYRSFADRGNLVVALGKDVSGAPAVTDISKTPHLLIAGSTGSGKSVCVNTVLVSLLYRYSPKELRLILVDPKRVEMTGYNGIAHLLTPVITDPDKTINALRWAVNEMENRYKILAESGAREIAGYNKRLPKEEEKMPYIVIVIDELADVMIQAAQEVEGLIVRIAQMARAVGIHLILATQRPSVNVVTGLIKANVPARIAFRVASQIDSRTIIDGVGAERLIGRGDMLYLSGDGQKPRRIQGVFIEDKEIKTVLDVIREQQEPQYNDEVIKPQKSALGSHSGGGANSDADDDMYQQAYDEVVRSGKASASFLQRRLGIGYARAARLLDLLEENNVIGPGNGAKAREVMVVSGDSNEMAQSIYEDDWGDGSDKE